MIKTIVIGSRWKLTRHPRTPIGKVTGHDPYHEKVDITWEEDLIPKHEKYDREMFNNGTFIEVVEVEQEPYGETMYGGGTHYCYHNYVKYTGFNEEYEYCTRCNKKKV